MVDSGALLKRCRGLNPYRGFESLPLRQFRNEAKAALPGGIVQRTNELDSLVLRNIEISQRPATAVQANTSAAGAK